MKRGLGVGLALILLACGGRAAPVQPAELRIEGLGWWRDHATRGNLTLLLGSQLGPTIGASGIEDAALVLYSRLRQEGYLQPEIRVRITEAGTGRSETFTLDSNLEHPLARGLAATKLVYVVKKGPRSTVGTVTFIGLATLGPDQGQAYFRGEGLLAALTSERAFSPEKMQRSAGNLLEELRRRGYAEAEVTATAKLDPKTQVAAIAVTVRQGPLWRVRGLKIVLARPGPAPADPERAKYGQPWSAGWGHDAEADLRRWYFQRGYADMGLALTASPGTPIDDAREVEVVARVRPGIQVRLGGVRFQGNTRTSSSVLRPLIKAKPGEPLNPLEAQDAQYRISRLGVFSGVDLHYDPRQGPVRDAVYDLREGKREDVDLLLGWGTNDQLRGGVELHNYDLWGLAHQGTLRLIQSLKSSDGEYDYSIPELFGSTTDLTDKVFFIRQILPALVAEQYGDTISASTPLPRIAAQLSTGYTFERLHASNNTLATVLSEAANANATSVQATLTQDRRDNPLLPRQGYKVSLEIEEASRVLGGQVDFQQVQFNGSYHTPWGHSRWIHLRLSHEVITTYGAKAGQQLPPNVFFYPGGGDSIRGYGLGQAAPRDPVSGAYAPAAAISLLTVELEQALTSKLSLVAFSDTLGATPTLTHYPFDYWLYSAGLGLRYQTIIGPIRLEYGRNLNPRAHDPSGTVQFSIGFPF